MSVVPWGQILSFPRREHKAKGDLDSVLASQTMKSPQTSLFSSVKQVIMQSKSDESKDTCNMQLLYKM